MSVDPIRLLGRPITLHWAGWETNTARLQEAGWQISAHQDHYRDALQLALRSPHGDAHGVSARMDYQYFESGRMLDYQPQLHAHLTMGRDVHFNIVGQPIPFEAVDAMPQYVSHRRQSLSDLNYFAAPLVRTRPIVVPEESVAELMERILKMQQPDRTARIQAALRNPEGYMLDRLPEQKFHAQIISFPNAA